MRYAVVDAVVQALPATYLTLAPILAAATLVAPFLPEKPLFTGETDA